jgi:hypothetical protein
VWFLLAQRGSCPTRVLGGVGRGARDRRLAPVLTRRAAADRGRLSSHASCHGVV